MKKLMILLLLVSVETAIAQPKGFYYYSRAGLGVSTFKNSSLGNQTGKLAFNVGLAGNYQINNYFGIIVEANLSSKGAKIQGTEPATFTSPAKSYEDIYRMFYVEIPILIKLSYPITDEFFVKGYGGLGSNFNLLGTYSRNYDDANNQDLLDQQINGITLLENSIVYGVGLEVKDKTDHLYSLDFRRVEAINSFGNIKNSQNQSISGYNQYYTIGFGYTF